MTVFVSNIAALKNVASAALPDGDEGGGLFRWADASTAVQDDCLTFRPNDTIAANPGRGIRITEDVITPIMAGAKADGTGDQGPAISAAIAAHDANVVRKTGNGSRYHITVTAHLASSAAGGNKMTVALFKNADTSAFAVAHQTTKTANDVACIVLNAWLTAPAGTTTLRGGQWKHLHSWTHVQHVIVLIRCRP